MIDQSKLKAVQQQFIYMTNYKLNLHYNNLLVLSLASAIRRAVVQFLHTANRMGNSVFYWTHAE